MKSLAELAAIRKRMLEQVNLRKDDNIDPSQIRIVVDMGEITTVGTYSVPAKVYLDTSDSVGVVGEYSVVVSISR